LIESVEQRSDDLGDLGIDGRVVKKLILMAVMSERRY
jgi:hypothetical protein